MYFSACLHVCVFVFLTLETSVTTYSLHPGSVKTELSRYLLSNEYIKNVLDVMSWPFLKDSYHGTQTTVFCAVVDELAQESGQYYE